MAGIDSYTKLMLHCNRPDATVPKAVTFGGTAQLDTAQKKFGASSLLLDGNSDYITVPDSADWYFGTGNFTVDCWIRANALPTGEYWGIWGQNASDGDHYYHFSILQGSGTYKFIFYAENNPTDQFYFTGDAVTINTGEWHHVALVRNSDVWTIYFDGVAAGTATDSYNIPDISGTFNIGVRNLSESGFDPAYFNGWIDSFRVSKGIARWTAAFTPPAYAPVSDTNTQLLLHFDGADAATATYDSAGGDENGTADKAPTYAGTAQIDTIHAVTFSAGAALDTAQKKFGTASCLIGANDGLQIASSPDWMFANGDFTLDGWFRWSSRPTTVYAALLGQYDDAGTANQWLWALKYSGGNYYMTWYYSDPEATPDALFTFDSAITISDNTWHHFAVVRSGNTYYHFVDGASVGTGSNTKTDWNDVSAVLDVGHYPTQDTLGLQGWVDAVRITKGYARWTSNFTPPTTAPVADTRTQLLLNFDDGADGATATNNEIGSLLTDTSGDYVSFPDSTDFYFTTADFTIDFWANFTTVEAYQFFCGNRISGNYAAFVHRGGADDYLQFYEYQNPTQFADYRASFDPVAGRWYHLAVERYGSLCKIFVDGTALSVTEVSAWGSPSDINSPFYVGNDTVDNLGFNGKIREFRFSKGIARWTSDFTPQVALYNSDPGTSIKKVSGVTYANIKKISGVAIASVKKVSGVA